METSNNKYSITVASQTIIKIILVIAFVVVIFRFTRSVSHSLTLIAISAFLALALNPLANWMHKSIGGNRLLAVILTYITGLFIIGGFLVAITPTLADQTISFVNDVPSTLQSLKTEDTSIARFARQVKLTDEIDNFTQDFSSHTQDITKFALNVLGRVTSAVVSIIAVLVLTFMMLIEGPAWNKRFWQLQSEERRQHYEPLLKQMYNVVTGYVNGQVLISFIGAIITLVLLLILGVPNASVLASIVFLTGLIPLIGHPIGAVIVTLLTMFTSLDKGLIVGIFFIVYLQVQAATIQPYVQAKSNDMTPLTVFIAALIGVAIAGFLGAFLAIPLAGCVRILFLDYINRKKPSWT